MYCPWFVDLLSSIESGMGTKLDRDEKTALVLAMIPFAKKIDHNLRITIKEIERREANQAG